MWSIRTCCHMVFFLCLIGIPTNTIPSNLALLSLTIAYASCLCNDIKSHNNELRYPENENIIVGYLEEFMKISLHLLLLKIMMAIHFNPNTNQTRQFILILFYVACFADEVEVQRLRPDSYLFIRPIMGVLTVCELVCTSIDQLKCLFRQLLKISWILEFHAAWLEWNASCALERTVRFTSSFLAGYYFLRRVQSHVE